MSNHSFYLASNTSSTSTLHIIFNLISLTATALGTFISFVILICVLLRKRTFKDVPLLLCTNNYLLVFVLGISELLHNVNTLRGDLEFLIMDKTTVMCRIHAYIQFSLVSAVYLACILQAVFRLCRIVYPTLLWLLDIRTYLVIIPSMWIISFALVSPLYVVHGHQLIPGEYICRITKDDSFSIAYATLIIYVVPFIILALVYYQVRRFLCQRISSANFDFRIKSRRAQRDIFVFRRITTMVILLGSYGMPNSIMLLILAATGELGSYFYRVLELSFSACVLTLSLALIFATSHVRHEARFCSRKTKVKTVIIHECDHRTSKRSKLIMATQNM